MSSIRRGLWVGLGATALLVALVVGVPGFVEALPGGGGMAARETPVPPARPPPTPVAPPFIPPPPERPSENPSLQPATPTPLPATPTPNPCLTPIPLTNAWQTYLAPDGSFSFEYPTGWGLIIETPDKPRWGNEASTVSIYNKAPECVPVVQRQGFFVIRVSVAPHGMRGTSLEARRAAADRLSESAIEVLSDSEIFVSGFRGLKRVIRVGTGPAARVWPQLEIARGEHALGVDVLGLPIDSTQQLVIFERVTASLSIRPAPK